MTPLLVFGLGNPGREYESTYHNAGSLAVNALKKRLEDEHAAALKFEKHFWYRKFPELILAGVDPNAELFMNESGLIVREALEYFKILPNRLVLLHDDSDLPIGTWRLEFGRGAAGHHGVESAVQILGTNSFWRGRIGIRPNAEPEGGRRKAGDFVLKPISKQDSVILENVFAEMNGEVLALAAG